MKLKEHINDKYILWSIRSILILLVFNLLLLSIAQFTKFIYTQKAMNDLYKSYNSTLIN